MGTIWGEEKDRMTNENVAQTLEEDMNLAGLSFDSAAETAQNRLKISLTNVLNGMGGNKTNTRKDSNKLPKSIYAKGHKMMHIPGFHIIATKLFR